MNPRAHEGVGFERLREGSLGRAARPGESEPDRLRRIRDHLDRGQRALRTYQEFQPYDGKVRAQNVAALRRLYDELRAAVAPTDALDRTEDVKIPSWVLKLTITEARAALEAWDRRGLTRARGDEALRSATLEAWRGAALDLGDVVETLRVNALLVETDRRTRGEVAYGQRRIPVLVAGLVLGREPAPDGAPPARDLERRRARATVLVAAGIDPNLSDLVAWMPSCRGSRRCCANVPTTTRCGASASRACSCAWTGCRPRTPRARSRCSNATSPRSSRPQPGDRRVASALEAVRARRGRR
jgi:hypothetical protein